MVRKFLLLLTLICTLLAVSAPAFVQAFDRFSQPQGQQQSSDAEAPDTMPALIPGARPKLVPPAFTTFDSSHLLPPFSTPALSLERPPKNLR